ncbi:MAG: dicarboxylate/amino acid:cation symporter [Myxococcota bacterium]
MNRLLVAVVAAVALALGSVVVFGGAMADVYWVGELFLRALQMIVVPLVVFSVISGITAVGAMDRLGRLGGRTALYFALMTLAASVVGALLVSVVRPGVGLEVTGLEVPAGVARAQEVGIPELILGLVSDDLSASLSGVEMLPLVVFSLVFGVATCMLGERGRPVATLCRSGQAVTMRVVRLVAWVAPLGVFGLVAGRFGAAVAEGGMEAFRAQLAGIGAYVLTVLLGLAIYAFVVLPLVLWVTTRRNPLVYLRGAASALLTGFATGSTAATLPLTLQAAEENNGVDPRAARFVLPLGATVHMDGTALYEAVAVVFIAQALGVDLSAGQVVLVALTAAAVAIGAAGLPEAGLVTMVLVLRAVDLPLAGVELVLAVDWLLGRFRTAVNVWGDSVGAAVLERTCVQRGVAESG